MNLQHILLTTDLSPEAIRPFESVKGLAQKFGSRVTLLFVVRELTHWASAAPPTPIVAPSLDEQIQDAQRAIDLQRELLGLGLSATSVVLSGDDVAGLLVRYASEHGVNLIAMSTHGRTGFRRLMTGSVAEEVVRTSPVPVLVFPRAED